MTTVLACDDDKSIVDSIELFLEKDGIRVVKCSNGKEAREKFGRTKIDLMIMDIMMPIEDGITAVKKIREQSDVPVIFLSAKSEIDDKVYGLEIGGDDYMTKPFSPKELRARVKVILKRVSRRPKATSNSVLKTGALTVNTTKKIVLIKNKLINVTKTEYNILVYFMHNIGKIVSSTDIYKEVWDNAEAYNIENTIAVHIRNLRKKIESDTKGPKYIKVIWGIGYKMESI